MNIGSYNNLLGDYNRNLNETLSKLYVPDKSVVNEEPNNEAQKISFGEIINNEIEKLNDKQVHADNMIQDLVKGEGQDLHNIMIATEEARLSLELAVQVRNKVIEGFNEIKNIQL